MSEKLRYTELVSTIESQKDQLRRYESRLRDLIRAYKGLQKEKDALEASVFALSAPDQCGVAEENLESSQGNSATLPNAKSRLEPSTDSARLPSDQDDGASASEAEKTDSEDATSASESGTSDVAGKKQLKNKVVTLSNAVSAITQEKNRMEQNFQGDKKRLMDEKEELTAQLTQEKERKDSELQSHKTQLQELRAKLRGQQLEREQEQTDHVVMISELQTLLTQQRSSRESLEQAFEEERNEKKRLKTALQAQEAMAAFASRPGVNADSKKSKDIESLPQNIENHPMMIKLQKEMQDLRAQHQRVVAQERSRSKEAEEKLSRVTRTSEETVRTLEDRISELSATVGTYERLRTQDQRSIETLKEELEKRLSPDVGPLPNSHQNFGRLVQRLSPVGSCNNLDDIDHADKTKFLLNEEMASDPHYLVKKMKDLKTKIDVLITSPDYSGNLIGPKDVVPTLFDEVEISEIHENCQQQIRESEAECSQLKEQLRIATIRARQESPVQVSLDENAKLKDRVVELENESMKSREEVMRTERRMNHELDVLREKLFQSQTDKERAKKDVEETWKEKLNDVVKEMSKQRDRTLLLLKEKEVEVEIARTEAAETPLPQKERSLSRASSFRSRHNSLLSEDNRSSSCEIGFSHSGLQSDIEPAETDNTEVELSHPGNTMLHVACREQLSRVDAEVRVARRQKGDLETSLRKLQNSLAMSEENHELQVERLNHEIERLTRNQHRASELIDGEKNMEYLKNVVYKLIISRDSASKLQLIPVVATILQFTVEEKNRALSKYQSWWGAGAPTI